MKLIGTHLTDSGFKILYTICQGLSNFTVMSRTPSPSTRLKSAQSPHKLYGEVKLATNFGGYSKTRYKKLFTHVESYARAGSLIESGEYRYIKAINNNTP